MFLTCTERKTLLKRADPQELLFYTNISRFHPEFLPFVPAFYGVIKLRESPECEVRFSLVFLLPHSFKVSYIELEDLTAGFRKPCVMDVKLGTRTYGPFACPAKVASQQAKAFATTAATLGLRLIGVKVGRFVFLTLSIVVV